MRKLVLCVAIGVLCLVLTCGCAKKAMKATPFYTGEYTRTVDGAEKRVNLWPLAYYRNPALSILWPIGEKTDDHFAVRPLVSVYDLDKEKREWNFLFPFSSLDFNNKDYHVFPVFWGNKRFVFFPMVWWYPDSKGIFPAFWGKDYFHVFPLFWHKDGNFGYTHCLPFWIHSKIKEGSDTWILPPFARVKKDGSSKGMHVFPFWGSYEKINSKTQIFFPLGVAYASEESTRDLWVLFPFSRFRWGGTDKCKNHIFPFYAYNGEDKRIITPLFSHEGGEYSFTNILGPVAYHQKDKGGFSLYVLYPLIKVGRGASYHEYGGLLFTWLTSEGHGSEIFGSRDEYRNVRFGPYLNKRIVYKHDEKNAWRQLKLEDSHIRSVFPLWRDVAFRNSRTDETRHKSSVLFRLYDTLAEHKRDFSDEDQTVWNGDDLSGDERKAILEKTPFTDYTRKRILIRLMHYENANGDTSLDIFPGLTWDKKVDGYSKFSLWWRMFRNERMSDGKRNMDIMFIPVRRDK